MRKDRLVGGVLGDDLTLSPSDLYNTDFRSSVMGGYDKKEVDNFLERVGDVFEALLKQIQDLKREIDQLHDQVDSSREMESTLRNALASAQKFHDDTLNNARREADAIREQAKVALSQAKLQARDLPDQLRREIGHLREERNQLRMDLEVILKTHAALLQKIPRAEEAAQEELPHYAREARPEEGELENGDEPEPWIDEQD